MNAATTSAARISFHVTTRNADTAHEAASRFVDTINRVWIVDDAAKVDLVADGVYLVRVHVTAPTHELHDRAPITQQAMYAVQHVAPADTLRFAFRGVAR